MNPFPIYRCGFRPLVDVAEWLYQNKTALENDPQAVITLSDVQPGRISEGEATLHPHFFEICEMVRSNLPNTLHITTNGSKLTEEFIDRMMYYTPWRVMISYHSCKMRHWTEIMNLSEREHEIATDAFRLLNQAGVKLWGAVVALPSMVGYNDILNTMLFMNKYCSKIRLWRPLYGKVASDELVEKMKVNDDEFKQFAHDMYKVCNNAYVQWDTDPDAPLAVDVHGLMQKTVECNHKKVMWLTAEINYSRLVELVNHHNQFFPNEHSVQAVINHAYGGNASCNGLLLVSDLNSAIESAGYEPDVIIAPSKMFDRFGNDLVGTNRDNVIGERIWWRRW